MVCDNNFSISREHISAIEVSFVSNAHALDFAVICPAQDNIIQDFVFNIGKAQRFKCGCNILIIFMLILRGCHVKLYFAVS